MLEESNVYDFEEGDIIQLLVSTAWHSKGELAIVLEVTSPETLSIVYENEDEPRIGFSVHFRRLPIEALEKKFTNLLVK